MNLAGLIWVMQSAGLEGATGNHGDTKRLLPQFTNYNTADPPALFELPRALTFCSSHGEMSINFNFNQMKSGETGNAIMYGSDIAALFHVGAQSLKLKRCQFSYRMKSLYIMWWEKAT